MPLLRGEVKKTKQNQNKAKKTNPISHGGGQNLHAQTDIANYAIFFLKKFL